MNDSTHGDQRRAPLALMVRHGWLVLLLTGVSAIAAYLISNSRDPKYEATAKVLLTASNNFESVITGEPAGSGGEPDVVSANNQVAVDNRGVAVQTARALGSRFDTASVQNAITVSPVSNTSAVEVTATAGSARVAARIANVYVATVVSRVRTRQNRVLSRARRLLDAELQALSPSEQASAQGAELRSRAAELSLRSNLGQGAASILEPAQRPTAAVSPKPTRDAGLAAIFGFVLAIGIAGVREQSDRRLRTEHDVSQAFALPVLAGIPRSRKLKGYKPFRTLSTGEAEPFRLLQARLRYAAGGSFIRSVVVTSAAKQEGKTTVAWNLAGAAASAGGKVMLIEADMRDPSLAEVDGLTTDHGLPSVLSGATDLDQAIRTVNADGSTMGPDDTTIDENGSTVSTIEAEPIPEDAEEGSGSQVSLTETLTGEPLTASRPPGGSHASFDVLPCGAPPNDPIDFAQSLRLSELIRHCEQVYDLVVIDTPSILEVADAIPLSKAVDGVLVVTRLASTSRRLAQHAATQLRSLDVPVLGVVVNNVSSGVLSGDDDGGLG